MRSNQFFKTILLAVSISFIVILLNACTSNTQDVKSLRIGMNTWPGYEPFVFAKEKGYLQKNVYISRLDSATDTIKAFKSGIIDVACLTLDEAIILQNSIGEPIKIITILDFSTGADAIISTKEIKSMQDLKGKKVGVESSALGAFMLSRAVDSTPGLTMNDLNIVYISYENHETAFDKENIDAVVTFEPVKTNLLRRNTHVIFDSMQIPGEILDVMVVKEETILEKELALQLLVDGWYESIEHISRNLKSSLQIMAKYEYISYEEFKMAYKGIKTPSRDENKHIFNATLDDSISKISTILLKKKLIRKKINSKNLYSDKFIKKVN